MSIQKIKNYLKQSTAEPFSRKKINILELSAILGFCWNAKINRLLFYLISMWDQILQSQCPGFYEYEDFPSFS